MKTFVIWTLFGFSLFSVGFQGACAIKLFSDVPPENQIFEAVSVLENRGILNGFPDRTFRPDQNVSRAEALKIILLSAGVTINGVATKNPFPDVPKDQWFAVVTKKGQELGIVKGNMDGTFTPFRNVSRAEAVAMLFRTNGDTLDIPEKDPFLDVPKDAWFAQYFFVAKKTNLLKGEHSDPHHMLTRGELANLTYRFFKNDWNVTEMNGKASYYGDVFEGRTTANGEKFSNTSFIAAHRTLPFGTRVRVTHTDSLRSVIVRITDRGPFVNGRVIDLSQSAFEVLAPLSQGVLSVQLEIVPDTLPLGKEEECETDVIAGSISQDYYDGIFFFEEVPRQFLKNEVYILTGKITADSAFEAVTAFYGPEEERTLFRGTVSGDIFSIPLFFPEEGDFIFSVFPGNGGEVKTKVISVRAQKCEKDIEEKTVSPTNMRVKVKNGETLLYWDDTVNNLFRVEFSQEEKVIEFFVSDAQKFVPPPSAFQDFSEGMASVKIWASTTEDTVFNRKTEWKYGGEQHIFLGERISRQRNRLTDIELTEQFQLGDSLSFSGSSEESLSEKAVIIDPNEDIFEITLTLSGKDFSGEFTPKLLGTYIIEINRDDAMALFVGASVPKGVYPLLPDYFDLQEKKGGESTKEGEKEKMPETMLKYINDERSIRNVLPLSLDENLQALAQFRADDMCERSYFSHVDPDGKQAKDYRVLYGVQTAIAENIAQDVHLESAHKGLMMSPAHRRAIINDQSTRVGIGFCFHKGDEEKADAIIVVEIFGGEPFSTSSIPKWREKILKNINTVRFEDPIVPSATVESIAQKWANTMAKENFLGFENGEESLESSLRGAGVNKQAKGIVFKLNTLSSLSESFSEEIIRLGLLEQENYLLDTDFQALGIGIAQNDIWEIFVVVLATH
jgi:rare lipoprotein A